jgi:AcrR family transcriptional regulator
LNRNTFYYHFQDIYALVEDIFERETERVIAKNMEHFSWKEGLMESLQFAIDNKKAVYHIYNSVNRELLERYLLRITDDLIEKVVRYEAQDLEVDDQDIHCITLFYKHAIVGLAMEWVRRGMKAEYEPVILRLSQIFDGNIRYALEKVSLVPQKIAE